jgi:hypothetical protein
MHAHAIDGTTSSDQTGFYVFDVNYICSVPIKNRSKEELLHAYSSTYEWLTLRGFKPLLCKNGQQDIAQG